MPRTDENIGDAVAAEFGDALVRFVRTLVSTTSPEPNPSALAGPQVVELRIELVRPPLLTRERAAEILSVSVDAVDRLRRSGELPTIDIGPVRIDPFDLEQLIKRRSR